MIPAIETIRTTIQIKKDELWDAQKKIHDKYAYNRWPDDDQYAEIELEAKNVVVILREISSLEELKRTIENNQSI